MNNAALRRWRRRKRVRIVSPSRIVSSPCDVFSPNALGGIISSKTKLDCRAVVGAANNPLADESVALALHRRGILFAPDFLVNAGGLIEGVGRNLGWGEKTEIAVAGIGRKLTNIYRRAQRRNQPPYHIALAMADARLKPGKPPSRMTMRMR